MTDDAPKPRSPSSKPPGLHRVLRLGAEGKIPLREDGTLELPEGVTAYDPEAMRQFVTGQQTLGDLEGITKDEQYQIAEHGYAYLQQGKLDDARTVFLGLLALDPFDAYFNLALGSVAQQKGEAREAVALYTRALEINPYSAAALANRGEVRVLAGELVDGAEDLMKALELDPQQDEPSTQRAAATLRALQEKLAEVDDDDGGSEGEGP